MRPPETHPSTKRNEGETEQRRNLTPLRGVSGGQVHGGCSDAVPVAMAQVSAELPRLPRRLPTSVHRLVSTELMAGASPHTRRSI